MAKKKITTSNAFEPEPVAMSADIPPEPAEREHVTDGSPCWCAPGTIHPDQNYPGWKYPGQTDDAPAETLTIRALTSFSMTMPQMRTVATGETLALPAATAIGLVNAGLAEHVK